MNQSEPGRQIVGTELSHTQSHMKSWLHHKKHANTLLSKYGAGSSHAFLMFARRRRYAIFHVPAAFLYCSDLQPVLA